jgi:hypothetical protein
MHRHGRTSTGKERYRCPTCSATSIIHRPDTRERHIRDHFIEWLTGKGTKDDVAGSLGLTRRALTKQFHSLFSDEWSSPTPKRRSRILVVDGTYIQGNALCVLSAVNENRDIFWKFAKKETYLTWLSFLSSFGRPNVVVSDGQKGLRGAVKELWGDVPFQRCQFHVVSMAIHVLSRKPKERAGQEILQLIYKLKHTKTRRARDQWIDLLRIWEQHWEIMLAARTASGTYHHPKLRRVRRMIRNALPHLFTFLDHPGAPNTTNLVEGWVNTEIARALRMHRGLHLWQKRTLVSVILSNLTRKNPTRKFP